MSNTLDSTVHSSFQTPITGSECPIYGKIRFLRNFIACFSVRTKKLFMAESTDFSRSRYSTEKKPFLDPSTDFFVLSSATTPPPPTLAYFARAE